MKSIKFFSFFIAAIFFSTLVQAQKSELGGGVGVYNYSGEINPFVNPVHSRPAGNLYYRFNASPAVSIRTAVTGGLLHGSEKSSSSAIAKVRQGNFNSTVFDLGLTFEYNFFDYYYKSKRDLYISNFSPYFTSGIAFFNYQTDYKEGNNFIGSYNSSGIAVPVGVGFKYRLREEWNLNFEIVARTTFTDDMDGIKEQPDPAYSKSPANPFTADWYYYAGISLSYTFHKVICP